MFVSPFGVEFCSPHECSECRKSAFLLNGHAGAEQWLASRSANPLVILSMRQVAFDRGHDRLRRLNDQDVIKAIAWEVASGALRLCDRNWETPRFVGTTTGVTDDVDDKPFPIQERTKTVTSAPPPPADPPTLPDVNVQAQAAALSSAAAQGVPFCAECTQPAAAGGN
jgi:hypothetical protein